MALHFSKLTRGYWGAFWMRSGRNRGSLMVALNEGGEDVSIAIRLKWGFIPVGYRVAIRIWEERWFRSYFRLWA